MRVVGDAGGRVPHNSVAVRGRCSDVWRVNYWCLCERGG